MMKNWSASRARPLFGAAVFALALSTGMNALTPSASATQFKRIQDVNVSCNNALRCDLFIANPRVTLSNFGFRRAAAPDAPVSIVMVSREQFSRGSEVRLFVNNELIATIDVADISFRAAVSEFIFSDQAIVHDVIDAAKAGGELRVEYRSRLGATSASFELGGYVEGLAFMDDVQGRTGRDSALSGGMAAQESAGDEVVEIGALANVPFAIRSRYYASTNALCGGITDAQGADLDGLRIGSVAGALYVLPCAESVGDEVPYAFFTLEGRDAHIVPLPVIENSALTTANAASNINFDAATGQVSGAVMSGTCGSVNTWQINQRDDGQLAFALVEARSQGDCDGVASDTQIWPPQAANVQN